MSATFEYPLIDLIDPGRDAVCMECGHRFLPSARYAERLIGFVDDMPVIESICLACDQAPAP